MPLAPILKLFLLFLQKSKFVKIKSILLFTLLCFSKIVFGQSIIKEIKGQISAGSTAVAAVTVVNTNTNSTQISDKNGSFSIEVSEGDVLIISAVQLETLRKTITKQDLELTFLKIEMASKSIFLKEVVVKKSEITAESLGIISGNIKRYTPAERKLYTATSTPVDALLNAISGRTAMLKKELVVEKKEILLAKTEYLFEDKYYTQTLKIPQDYIKGFQYYCIEDSDFVKAVESKNKTLIMFRIIPLAQKYIALINTK
jgi:CarboxypepD_reg-like domain